MKFEVQREALLKPIQAVIGVVERRQTMPILANILLSASENGLSVTGTDLEVELVAQAALEVGDPGDVTVPGRKLLDICRALPEGSLLKVSLDKERLIIRSGRSRFTLSTLPAAEFPTVDEIAGQQSFEMPQKVLKDLLERTQFSMAQQDVRYYLNGLLLEMHPDKLRAVATDGHRLALCDVEQALEGAQGQQIIVPRKGVLELLRLLEESEEPARVETAGNHIRVQLPGLRFTSKLIDGRFPDYERVVPKGGDKVVAAQRLALKEALGRAAILSNEKYRGIRLQLAPGKIGLQTHNPEQEEAEDEVAVGYEGAELEIGFNVTYLMEALAALDGEEVTLTMTDSNSSCLIHAPDSTRCRYVVMPMRL